MLILNNLVSDFLSSSLSKKPLASGTVIVSTLINNKYRSTLLINHGKVHEGSFIRSKKFSGTVIKLYHFESKNSATHVDIEGSGEGLRPGEPFKTYSTLRIVNTSLLIELTLIFLFFYHVFRNNGSWKTIAISAAVLSIITWIIRNIILDKLHTYGGAYNGGTTIIILILALAYYFQQLNRSENYFIYSSFSFWIVSAILFYKAGTFFLFLYFNTLEQNEKANYNIINSAFYILQNLLFAIAFFIRENYSNKNISILNKK